MKIKLFALIILMTSINVVGCQKQSDDGESKITTGSISERLKKLSRITSFKSLGGANNFQDVYEVMFKQYIDHNNPKLGTFNQKIQFGFTDIDAPNVLTTNGYSLMKGINFAYYSEGETELASLLEGNYLYVEHRYFGDSLPVKIDYDNNNTWKYLTTEQAAHDYHEIVKQFKRILDGKWLSTGVSKSGMTTELFAYYHPGDVDLYVPYVAPFCNSRNDKRMMKFVYEEAGNQQYTLERAAQLRQEVLDFQVTLLNNRDLLVDRFYNDGIKHATYTTSTTKDRLFDAAVIEYAVGFWQYYQEYKPLEKALKMSDSTEQERKNKADACYQVLTSVCAPSDFECNGEYSPYYVQAYQELGNYCYDFSYIREALEDQSKLTIAPEEDETLAWSITLTETQLQLEKKNLVYTKINNMLKTTDEQFVIIYGSSDPWYAVRPDDVTDRENISIYVNTKHPHTTNISNFPRAVSKEILNKIKGVMLPNE